MGSSCLSVFRLMGFALSGLHRFGEFVALVRDTGAAGLAIRLPLTFVNERRLLRSGFSKMHIKTWHRSRTMRETKQFL